MGKAKIREGKAIIKKSGGTTINILFGCIECGRVSIWTNDFLPMFKAKLLMRCAECGGIRFEVTGVLNND